LKLNRTYSTLIKNTNGTNAHSMVHILIQIDVLLGDYEGGMMMIVLGERWYI
jgi:hypothetical protein